MCKSVKGAAYFGSSIHVVAAFIFLFWFLFDTVITEVHIDLWRCSQSEDDTPRKHSDLVHYLNLPFKFLYYMCLCITGIYVFRGVERNAPRVIKFALLVFVLMQIIGLALFITISFNYWEDESVNGGEELPTASRLALIDPNMHLNNHPNQNEPIIYDIVGSEDESSDENDYSINIEVFSHPPNSQPPHPHNHPPEIHHSQDIGLNIQKPVIFQPPDHNHDHNHHKIPNDEENISKGSESGPENLVLVPAPTEVNSDFDFEIFPPVQNQDSSSSSQDVVRILQKDGREFLTFPSAPQSMLLEPGTTEPQEKAVGGESMEEIEEEIKAVLESPLDADLDLATTTPMSPPMDKNDKEEMDKADVVVVKVMPKVPKKMPLKPLSHNQLVTLVFQIFLVGFNAVFSTIYVIVLMVHLTSL